MPGDRSSRGFYRLLVNVALQHLRKARRSTHLLEPAPIELAEANIDHRLWIEAAVRDLPADERAVVVLGYYLDLDEQTVAEVPAEFVRVGGLKSRLCVDYCGRCSTT